MDPAVFRRLLLPSGQELLAQAAARQPREADFLAHFDALSRSYPPELARAALETVLLRQSARVKFPEADKMYFTREALEQASSFAISQHRAGRYAPFSGILDLGCSVGSDTLSLAELHPVISLDLDPVRLLMAQANCAALGKGGRTAFLHADLLVSLPLRRYNPGWGAFFDPARRAGYRRIHSVRAYQPPLARVQEWLADYPALGVKLSPGVDLAELAGYSAEVEFISLGGELKEAVLWFGPLQSAAFRATLLPGGHSLASSTRLTAGGLELSEPQEFIYEPDPAVLRAGLVQVLGEQLEAAQLDPDIAYLTAGHFQPTPFARAWRVEAWFPFSLKRLRSELRARKVGRITVKKRGSPLEPERLIRELRLQGEQERTVILTHLRGRPLAILCLPDKLDALSYKIK